MSALAVCLRPHSAGESVAVDHPQLVNSAGDAFVLIVGVELKGNQRSVGIDDPGRAGYLLAERCRRLMLEIQLHADRAFAVVEQRQHGLAGGMFQKPDKPRRAQYGRHLPVGEVDRVLLGDDKRQLTNFTYFRLLFNGSSPAVRFAGDRQWCIRPGRSDRS